MQRHTESPIPCYKTCQNIIHIPLFRLDPRNDGCFANHWTTNFSIPFISKVSLSTRSQGPSSMRPGLMILIVTLMKSPGL